MSDGFPLSPAACRHCGDWPCTDAPEHGVPADPGLCLRELREQLRAELIDALLFQLIQRAKETTMTETKIPTKEEARQAREAIRAFRAAEREKRAARKDRRDERAEEIALHREAEAEAQKMIDAIKSDIDRMDITIGAEQNDIENARKRLATLKDNRAKAMDKLDKQYAERQAARDALKKLNAEIKGTTTPSAKE